MYIANIALKPAYVSTAKFSAFAQCNRSASLSAATSLLREYNRETSPAKGLVPIINSKDIPLGESNTAPRIIFPDCTKLNADEGSFPRYLLDRGFKLASLATLPSNTLVFQRVDDPSIIIAVSPKQLTGQAWANHRKQVATNSQTPHIFQVVLDYAKEQNKLIEIGKAA